MTSTRLSDRRNRSVPVTIVTDPAHLASLSASPGTAVVRPEAMHDHPVGTTCVACDSRADIRVLLFELNERLRLGLVPAFDRVVVDATVHGDPAAIENALIPGRLPALALRDHVVARTFHLASSSSSLNGSTTS